MRLLHDTGALDSVTTPVVADEIFTGVARGSEGEQGIEVSGPTP